MKITIWIRNDDRGEPTLRTDMKYEDRDTPMIQMLGNKLIEAIKSGTGK